jgi:hypothetical protein
VEEEHILKIHLEDLLNNNNNIKAIHINNKMELTNKDIDGLNKLVLLINNQIGMIQTFRLKFLINYSECKIKPNLVEEEINSMTLYVKLCNNS